MRKIIFLFLIMPALPLFAQKNQEIEPAILECQYKLRAVKDTIKGTFCNEDIIILRIGKTMSQEFSSYTYYGDSLLSVPGGGRILGLMMVEAIQKRDYANVPGARIMGEYLYKDFRKNKITTFASVHGTDRLTYEEDYDTQEWIICDSTKQLLGYDCQLAQCDFRGRKYNAWFAPDIPINAGLWKFKGLPGLIIEAYDQQKHYHYEMISIRKEHLKPVTIYNLWEKKPTKTTRIKYLQAERRAIENPVQAMKASSGIDLSPADGSVGKALNCDFLEKDYWE